MTTKKAFEAWAWPILRKYQSILLIQDHNLTFEYDDTMRGGTLMEHANRYPYKETNITYGDTAIRYFKDKKHNDLRGVLIHELCHSVTDPLYVKACNRYATIDDLADERERLTDHIANVVLKLGV